MTYKQDSDIILYYVAFEPIEEYENDGSYLEVKKKEFTFFQILNFRNYKNG